MSAAIENEDSRSGIWQKKKENSTLDKYLIYPTPTAHLPARPGARASRSANFHAVQERSSTDFGTPKL